MGAGLGKWRECATERCLFKLLTITDNVDQDNDNLFDSFAAATKKTKHKSVGYYLVMMLASGIILGQGN